MNIEETIQQKREELKEHWHHSDMNEKLDFVSDALQEAFDAGVQEGQKGELERVIEHSEYKTGSVSLEALKEAGVDMKMFDNQQER